MWELFVFNVTFNNISFILWRSEIFRILISTRLCRSLQTSKFWPLSTCICICICIFIQFYFFNLKNETFALLLKMIITFWNFLINYRLYRPDVVHMHRLHDFEKNKCMRKKRICDDIQQKYKYKKFYFKSGIYKT